MIVRILNDTDYAPSRSDSPRCWGQLRYRTDGEELPSLEPLRPPKTGKRVTFFPAGATPDVPNELANEWLLNGTAEAYTGDEIHYVESSEILKDVKTQ